jgi:hypothetical protein
MRILTPAGGVDVRNFFYKKESLTNRCCVAEEHRVGGSGGIYAAG